MKHYVTTIIFAFAVIILPVFSQNRSIAFEHGSFKEIKEKALKENKLIFIDAFTTWCGPCKQMANTVFTNDTVADYFNSKLVNAKIDMEKGEGIDIAKLYEVQCYPNLLFIDGNGKLVHRIAGSMSASDFVTLAKVAAQPDKCFSYFSKNYETNKHNATFLIQYIKLRESTCLEIKPMLNDYFALQKETALTSSENWDMIKSFVNSIESREFKYLIANKDKFSALYTSKEVDEKLADISKNSLNVVIYKKPFDEPKYKEIKTKIVSFNLPSTKLILFESDFKLAERNADWKEYAKLAIENVDAYYLNDANALNSIAWTFYESVEDKTVLLKAVEWGKKASELVPEYGILDTYASILYKAGKKEMALQIANKAINLAKKENYPTTDYEGTTELIKKINAMK